MAAKPTNSDDLDVRLSWPQGTYADASGTKSRGTGGAPGTRTRGRRSSEPDGGGSAPASDHNALSEITGRLERLEEEFRAQIEELAEKVDRMAAAAADDTERVLKALETVRRRLPVSARSAASSTAGSGSSSALPPRRPRS